MPVLELDERRTDAPLTLSVCGEVDSSSASELRDALRRVPRDAAVVIDLRELRFMDSAGLGALICGIREIRMREGRAVLCTRRGAVQRLLAVTGFDRVVPTFSSLEEACAAIAG